MEPKIETPKKEKKESSKLIYIVIIIFLLGINGYLFYEYKNTDSALADKTEKLESTDDARKQLDSVLRITQLQLEEYKGKNEELDMMINGKNEELRKKAAEIETLLRNRQISKKDLEKALSELDVFKYYARKYQKQVDSLSFELKVQKEENEKLKTNLTSEQRRSQQFELNAMSNEIKIKMAQKLSAPAPEATAIRVRGNGHESPTTKASKTEQLKLVFTVADNPVADKNKKDIYLKIIGPDGTTQYIEETGSGKFKFENQETMYTVKKTVDFDNAGEPITIYWKKGSDFQNGTYKFELYCEGYLIGQTKLVLK
jgi:myosin heavy subunit